MNNSNAFIMRDDGFLLAKQHRQHRVQFQVRTPIAIAPMILPVVVRVAQTSPIH